MSELEKSIKETAAAVTQLKQLVATNDNVVVNISDNARQLIARLTVLYFMGRPHSLICDCPACKAWDECDRSQPATYAELDSISGRKSEPPKVL